MTDFNERLDNKINDSIQLLLNAHKVEYSLTDLDKKVNDEETLREYLADSEKYFGLEHKKSFVSTLELNNYVDFIDDLWR